MENYLIDNRKIDLQEAVSLLGVSSATIRNWIRNNYLTPQRAEKNTLTFDFFEVKSLKDRIISGEINRLNKRANKKQSTSTFIPDEYADNKVVISLVQSIIDDKKSKNLELEGILLAITLNLFRDKGLVKYSDEFSYDKLVFKNKTIENELNLLLQSNKNYFSNDGYNGYISLLKIELPKVNDILGLVYQSVSAEGSKSQAGSYYTPKSIVDEIVNEYVNKNSVVLDPCCGTGQFILSSADKVNDPENLWGFDIDKIAVSIARLNLLMKFPNKDFTPNIYHKNTLTELKANNLFSNNNIPRFDVIITNPPWGVHFSQKETKQLQNLYPSIKSNEAFSYFIDNGLDLLKKGGILAFILPEATLNIKIHRDIRNLIVEKTKIKKIKYLNRVFKNVFTSVIRIDILNEKPLEDALFIAEKENNAYEVKQSRLRDNTDYIFDVFNNKKDISIFDKVYNTKHITLENNAEWALGIVSGDNKKHLSENKTKDNEPILTGKDIKRFITNEPTKFIRFEPKSFQQVAPEEKYRAEQKLIYKFISKELVFSYDDKKTLTLNSANILIPRVNGYPIKSILALFNSPLYQFIYQKKFNSFKILRSDIEKLPLPILSDETHQKINNLVEKILDTGARTAEIQEQYLKLNDCIMSIFSMNKEEQNYIKENIDISDKLLNINQS